MEKYQNMMQKSEFYGRIFAVLALIIPGISWGYVLLFTLGNEESPNLGLFGFSSMTASGLIGVSVGITLLKHSKAIQPYVEKLSDEIIHLRKLRIICLSRNEFPEYDNLIVMVIKALLERNMQNNKPNESESPKTDNAKEKNSNMLSALSSIM
ncbi:MAG: hypothetical protein KAH84_05225 [Thiomargarita sp.]|nr:hypothetical protein [Thiomargarita sp.]